MRKIYFTLVVTTLILYVSLFSIPYFWVYLYEGKILNALAWNSYGSKFGANELIGYLFMACYGVVSIGLVLFKGWARLGFVVLTIFSVVTSPFWGLSVQYGFGSALSYMLALGDGAILAIVFLTSISDEFESTA